MKNPYRQLRQLPLRNIIALTAGLLVAAKGATLMYWFNNPSRFQSLPGEHWGPVGVGATALFDLIALYYVSMGWYDLYRKPWAVLPSALVNLGVTILVATLAGLFLTDQPQSRRTMVLIGMLAGPPLLLALIQLIASVKLWSRIRPSAPPMI